MEDAKELDFSAVFNARTTYGDIRAILKTGPVNQLDWFHDNVKVLDKDGAVVDLDDLPAPVAMQLVSQALDGFLTVQ